MIKAELNKLLKNLNKCVEALLPTLPLLTEFAAKKIKQETVNEKKMSDPFGQHYHFSARVTYCLHEEGVRTVEDLIQKTQSDLLCCRNFGAVSLREVERELAADGLSLGKERRDND